MGRTQLIELDESSVLPEKTTAEVILLWISHPGWLKRSDLVSWIGRQDSLVCGGLTFSFDRELMPLLYQLDFLFAWPEQQLLPQWLDELHPSRQALLLGRRSAAKGADVTRRCCLKLDGPIEPGIAISYLDRLLRHVPSESLRAIRRCLRYYRNHPNETDPTERLAVEAGEFYRLLGSEY